MYQKTTIMRYQPIPKELFIRNRRKLVGKLSRTNPLIVVHANDEMPRNGDVLFAFRQNSDLFYLTGIDQEKTILVLCPGHPDTAYKEILFILKKDEQQEIWEGKKFSATEAQTISGIKNIQFLDDFKKILYELMLHVKQVYINLHEHPRFTAEMQEKSERFRDSMKKIFHGHQFKSLTPLMTQLRLLKEEEETALVQQASDITKEAFFALLKQVRPGIFEYEIEATIIHEFIRHGANGHAYLPIVASGKNACTLHYEKNDDICKDGSLVLLDFGAEYGNYAADCSRTIPVNGKFSERQRELYNAVLRIMKKSLSLFVPGTTINQIQKKVIAFSEEEHVRLGLYTKKDLDQQAEGHQLVKRYFMHGVSHYIGLDVHDPGDKDIILKPGMILSCEPGIYIPEESTGIRIEDTILITENQPYNFMKNIPVEPDEIEALQAFSANHI